MKTERVITVRMTPQLHAALNELRHNLRADSVNKLCVRILTDACMADKCAQEILLRLPEESPNLFPATVSTTPESSPKNDDS